MWTACGDSIARAYDAKSGTLKRSYIGHEAAVNCMVINEGKLYTGSSDGTLRIWDAKDVSEELLVDDGPPPPAPIPVDEEGVDPDAVPADGEEQPDGESEPVADGEGEEPVVDGGEVQDIEEGEDQPEEGEGTDDAPAEDTPAEDAPAEDDLEDPPAEDKEVDDEMDEMERELAAQG